MATLGGALALNARRHPDKTALIFGESTYSYEQLAARINQYAHALASLGVGKGDRVALLSPNSDAYILGLYGAFRLGAIAVPLNPRVPARELRYLLEDSGATVLLYSEGLAVVVAGLDELDPLPSAPQSLVLDEPAAQGIARLADTMPTTAPEVEVIEDDDCIILYTSGTTGRPKGAVFDHHRMLWVGNSVSALGMNIFDRNLHVAPMYHCAELVLFVMSGFSLGTTHVVLPAFEPKAVLDALEKHRITVFLGVPTMYQMLLQHPELGTRDLSAWRLGFFGAAPMPPSAATSLLATLPHVQFFQLCGQTEGGPTGIFLTPDEVRARPDATGRASITNAETRIVDDEGNDTAVGEPGEIIYRGETIMKGYWNKPEATADALRDGWLHSGDVAVRDADGFITIVDRMKDMIITGGRNVYSVEVEQALAGHPDVADVAVVGRPDEMFGESLIAVVTPVEGREVTLESLREYGSQFIAGYKLPRELITRPIPRNPSGKTGSPETVRCVFTVRELNVYDVCSQLENSTCTFEGVDVPRTFLARSIGYAAAALLVATATATAGAPAVAEPADAPVENGGLLRSVKTDLLAGAIPTGVKATSVTYRSSDTRGKPVATTGIVMVPASKWTGRGPRPLVTYAVGTHGSDPSCRPSQLLTRGLTTDRSGVPMIELQLLDVASLLTRGFAVTMTDFQGTEAPGRLPYLQPIPQAHAVLDAARAAISVGAVDRRAPVGIWGYSQGGGAAAAAAEQAKSYAPELNIRGSVVGAPPTNPARTMMFNEGKLSAGVIGYFVNGVRAEYPQLAPKIDAKLNSQGRDFLRKTAGECLVGSVVGHYFRSTKGMTVSGRPLIEELASDPEINSVFQSFVMGRTAPSHPVLLMQNVNDDVVPADDANATADAWKRGGTNVARANINTPSLPPIGAPGHAVGLVTGNIAVNWLAGRLTQ